MWSEAAHSNENWMRTLLAKPRNPVPCWLHQNYQWDRDTGLQVPLLSEFFSVNIVLPELENVNSYYKCSIFYDIFLRNIYHWLHQLQNSSFSQSTSSLQA